MQEMTGNDKERINNLLKDIDIFIKTETSWIVNDNKGIINNELHYLSQATKNDQEYTDRLIKYNWAKPTKIDNGIVKEYELLEINIIDDKHFENITKFKELLVSKL